MKNITRRQFLGVFGATAAVAGLGLVGCGGSASTGSSSTGSSSGSKVDAIKSRGKLNAGVKKDVPGYGYLDPATNTYQGLEIDLCYQIAAAVLGVSYDEAKEKELVAFTDVTPKTRGPLIDNDQLDIVCATYTITDERKQSWDFSTPYRTDYIGLLVKKDAGLADLKSLDNKIIGVSQGSTTKDAITKMLSDQGVSATPTFQEFPDYPSIKSALDSGNIDVFSVDRSILGGYIDDSTELLAPDVKFGEQKYGIATKKDSDLSKVVDDKVNELLGNGWVDQEISDWKLL
ncbi:transporter substrate-binding domain-containing protein [uncultured Parolsenella sp.]|uniref:substrate-binding domain-containing protein n=1 Tax=uncultured Parolsenella sp. TaxID=2083008 RepID=UPI0027D9A1B6|nr:transporter substrate-binding domain-containing protein [uncultured Parolsenella sp.]